MIGTTVCAKITVSRVQRCPARLTYRSRMCLTDPATGELGGVLRGGHPWTPISAGSPGRR